MSMPEGKFTKKSFGVLLCGVGGDQGQSAENGKNSLSIEEQIVCRKSKITTEKSNDSSVVILDKRKYK